MTKIRITKLLLIIVAVAFCLSNATMGELLTHGHEIHYEHNTVHVHHINGDHGLGGHGLGEKEHRDAKHILSFDYLSVNTTFSHSINIILKLHLPFHFSLQQDSPISWIASRIFHHILPERYYSTSLYQLNSTYLI